MFTNMCVSLYKLRDYSLLARFMGVIYQRRQENNFKVVSNRVHHKQMGFVLVSGFDFRGFRMKKANIV